MRKIVAAIMIGLLLFVSIGCASRDGQKHDDTTNPIDKSDGQEFQANLGGIKIGDSESKVFEILGNEFEETVYDEALSLGEPFVKRFYKNGMMVVIGTDSKKVLEISTSSAATSNNLGFKVGDKAEDVLTYYRSKYKEAQSNQGDGKLIGWFILKDQELVIFNFEKGDSMVNKDIKPDSVIERIRLTNMKYMD